MTVEEGIEAAVNGGLDGIVLTEHNVLWKEEELTPYRQKAPSGFGLMVGVEVNCAENHFLVYGLSSMDGIYYGIPADDLLTIAHSRGAAVIAAHPYRWDQWQGDVSYQLDLEGVEVNSSNTSPAARRLAERLAEQKGIHAITASDAHSTGLVGKYWQEVPDDLTSIHDLALFLKSR
jgi:predicted metal-dependent phosphoesterase TrpH